MSENIKSIGKILAAMFGVTAVLLLILAFLVQRFYWENGMISVGISIVYGVSCFLGGFFAGKVQKTRKFVWGILMGFAYILVILALTLVVKHGFQLTLSEFVMNLLLCLGSGMLGGMLS